MVDVLFHQPQLQQLPHDFEAESCSPPPSHLNSFGSAFSDTTFWTEDSEDEEEIIQNDNNNKLDPIETIKPKSETGDWVSERYPMCLFL